MARPGSASKFLLAVAVLLLGDASLRAVDMPANPSFSNNIGDTIRDHDFGTFHQGAAGATFNFSVFNVPAQTGTTSPMSLTSTSSLGHTTAMSLQTGTVSGLAPGGQSPMQLVLTTDQAGRLAVSYTMDFGSDSLGGAFAGRLAIAGHVIVAPQGDYDLDGDVDNTDYSIWRSSFGTTNTAADGNNNNIIDAGDYTVWRKKYTGPLGSGNSAPGGSVLSASLAVPEPAAAIIWFLGATIFALRARNNTRRRHLR